VVCYQQRSLNPELLKKLLYHILLPLITGLMIYLFLREPITTLHKVLRIEINYSPLPQNYLTNFVLFYLPDMLWAYALTASLLLCSTLKTWKGATLAILLLSVVECVQANWQMKVLDWLDLGCMLISVFLAIVIIRK
jgi:hypothetical protein